MSIITREFLKMSLVLKYTKKTVTNSKKKAKKNQHIGFNKIITKLLSKIFIF